MIDAFYIFTKGASYDALLTKAKKTPRCRSPGACHCGPKEQCYPSFKPLQGSLTDTFCNHLKHVAFSTKQIRGTQHLQVAILRCTMHPDPCSSRVDATTRNSDRRATSVVHATGEGEVLSCRMDPVAVSQPDVFLPKSDNQRISQ